MFAAELKPPFSAVPEEVFALVAGEPEIRADALNLFPNLKLIARFGRGLDRIDVSAAKEKGIIVTTVPQGSRRSVAEHAVGLMFALARNISQADAAIKKGSWERLMGSELRGKTVGVVGFGNIGKEVAKICLGIGMRVVAFDPYAKIDGVDGVEKSDLETLLATSDFITLHVPLLEGTVRLVDYRALKRMKSTAFLINTARGEVMDEKALLEALENKKIAGAALDVFSEEPPFKNQMLAKLAVFPNVIATPHIASFTPEAQYEVAKAVWQNIRAVRDGRKEDLTGIA